MFLQSTGVLLTDQGLGVILLALITAIFGAYAYTYKVHEKWESTTSRLDKQEVRHEIAYRRAERFFEVLEANAIESVLGRAPNPMNQGQYRIAEMLRDAGSSAGLENEQIADLIRGLDNEKTYLEAQLKLTENAHRVEHLARLSDVKNLLQSLNARLGERLFIEELQGQGVEVPARMSPSSTSTRNPSWWRRW